MFKFSVTREDILKPVEMISGPAPTGDDKLVDAIIKNVYLSAFKVNHEEDDSLYPNLKEAEYGLLMKCTDTEIEMMTAIPLLNSFEIEEGETTVSVDKLKSIIKSLPEGSIINFSLEANNVKVATQVNTFNLVTQPAIQFPSIDSSEPIYSLLIKKNSLLNLLRSTSLSLAQDNYRMYLKGMRFSFDEKILHVYAADGHRLSMNNCELEDITFYDEPEDKGFLCPKKGVMELIKVLEQNKELEEPITLTLSRNCLKTNVGNVILVSKLIDLEYPPVETLIPNSCEIYITVDKEEFLQSLRRVGILSSKTNSVDLLLDKRQLVLSSRNNFNEEAKEVLVPIECSDNTNEIIMNSNYLIDICKAISNKQIKISMSITSKNALIEPICSENEEINNAKYVVSRRIKG